jgi:hypothetical protein
MGDQLALFASFLSLFVFLFMKLGFLRAKISREITEM